MISSLLFLAIQTFAAVPSTLSPLELLSLPEGNRVEIAKKNAKNLYPQLMEMAFNEERSVPTRWKALILAAEINREGSSKDLDRALRHNEWFMRNAALMALKTANPPRAQAAALQLLSDKALVVRSAAVSSIEEKPSDEVRDVLWNELRAPYNFRQGQGLWIRREIVEKLAAHPERREFNSFVTAFKDADKDLHSAAMMAFEKITGKHFGNQKSTVQEREALWMDYLKKNPTIR